MFRETGAPAEDDPEDLSNGGRTAPFRQVKGASRGRLFVSRRGTGARPFLGKRPMPTAKKQATIEELRERIAGSANLFFTDFKGLTVEEITKLRGELRKDGTTYSVVKNTLFSIAAGEQLAKIVEKHLAGPTGVVFAGTDPVAPAKALKQFATDANKLEVKAAYIDGKLVGPQEVEALASLPPRAELLAKLVGTLANPLRGLVTVLQGNQSGLVRALNAIREKKLAESATE
jgi:large subunit ribosomal protein L10